MVNLGKIILMGKKKDLPVLSKIEFDEKTAEPVIVEVKANSLPENTEKQEVLEQIEQNDSYGKQIEMPSVTYNPFKYNEETSTNKRQKIFKNVFYIAFVVLVLGVLIFTAFNDFASGKELPSFGEIASILYEKWYFLPLALLALFGCYLFKALKLSIFCKEMTGKWHFRTCMETGILGIYYNNVTPLAVGGQPFEIYHLSKHGVHGGVASSLPIATFFLNQLAFVLLGILSLVLFKSNAFGIPDEYIAVIPSNVISVVAIIGLVLCIFIPSLTVIFSIFPKIGSVLVHWVVGVGGKLKLVKNPKLTTMKTLKTVVHNSKCIKKISRNVPVLLVSIILSVLEWLSVWSIAFFSLKFFGYNLEAHWFIEWLQIMQLCSILYAAISFIPTPGNSGAADLSFYLLFATGVAPGLAFPSMLTWRFLCFYSTIIIGFVLARARNYVDKKHKKEQE